MHNKPREAAEIALGVVLLAATIGLVIAWCAVLTP